MPHGVPLRVKSAGRGVAAVRLPLKPKLTDPPAGSAVFHDSPVALTTEPAWVIFADQAWVTVCPAGRVHRSHQALSAAGPLVTVTEAVKPVLHSLVVQPTRQPPAGAVTVGVGEGVGDGDSVGDGDADGVGVGVGV